MTSNQLTYWKNIETERANRISEELRTRELSERERANRAQERLAAAANALARAQLAWDQSKFSQNLDYNYWATRFKEYGMTGDLISSMINSRSQTSSTKGGLTLSWDKAKSAIVASYGPSSGRALFYPERTLAARSMAANAEMRGLKDASDSIWTVNILDWQH